MRTNKQVFSVKNSVKTLLKWQNNLSGVKCKVLEFRWFGVYGEVPPSLQGSVKRLVANVLTLKKMTLASCSAKTPKFAATGL